MLDIWFYLWMRLNRGSELGATDGVLEAGILKLSRKCPWGCMRSLDVLNSRSRANVGL